ncbi:uncharacterized protein BHQ10_005999 [Talaromyces amestolkiae]|uniref:ABM domain-containing protein n=1 Tax=Talaromyces amestolkiae TaxID=1196081 RepID=A0A364L2F8_TALAM|nr:uncharacterized protein BHQ10_005999 [Talaromyces amestolkiae]RAO69987.1 hypothetical protein BHQ10_005999 [Talaromyces amestolkiae]
MAVTELALFHFKNNKGIEAPENKAVKEKILTAIKGQASYSSYPVHLLTQVEDPSYLYLLGGWDSVETHVEKWIPSKTNHDLLAELQDGMEVVWLEHLDVAPISHSPGSVNNENASSVVPLSAPVIAISRCFIKPGNKVDFQSIYSANQHHLDTFVKPWSTIGGWRLDPETRNEDNSVKDEFVLFSGWHSVEDHSKFAESEGFKDFGKIEEFLLGAEIKHAVLSVTS